MIKNVFCRFSRKNYTVAFHHVCDQHVPVINEPANSIDITDKISLQLDAPMNDFPT